MPSLRSSLFAIMYLHAKMSGTEFILLTEYTGKYTSILKFIIVVQIHNHPQRSRVPSSVLPDSYQ